MFPIINQLTYIPTIRVVIIFIIFMTVVFSYFGFVSYVVCQNDKQQPFDNLVQSFPVNLMVLKQRISFL